MVSLIKRLDDKILHYTNLVALEEDLINKTIDSQPGHACYADFIKDLEAIKSDVLSTHEYTE